MEAGQRIPALDGLRATGCMLVVYCHAMYNQFLPPCVITEYIGVMIFFTLSGFLMAHLHPAESLSRRGWMAFFAHRFIRVYPPFFLATFGYLALQSYLPPSFPLGNGEPWQAIIPTWLLYEHHGVFWTIPIELECYLLYPLAVPIAFISKTPMAILYATIMLLGFGFMHGHWGPMMSQNVMFCFFFGGVLSARFYKKFDANRIPALYWEILTFSCLGVLVFSMVAPIQTELTNPQYFFAHLWAFVPLMSCLLLGMAHSRRIIPLLFANAPMRFLGSISYSVYLTHIFVVLVAAKMLDRRWYDTVILLSLVLAAGIAYHRAVERPCILLAKKVSERIKDNERCRA